MQNNLDKIFVALDDMSLEEAKVFLASNKSIRCLKLGLELYLKYGNIIFSELQSDIHRIFFLDLKLHDIPQTVFNAIRSLSGLPIHFLTIHLSGGREMLEAAKKSRDIYLPNTKLVGVSVLTSINEPIYQEIFQQNLTEEIFVRLFNLASYSHIDAVVSSGHETALLKKHFPHLLSITPGIRMAAEISNNQNLGDQKRVLTPKDAFNLGADYLVMGRSITKAHDVSKVLEELNHLSQ